MLRHAVEGIHDESVLLYSSIGRIPVYEWNRSDMDGRPRFERNDEQKTYRLFTVDNKLMSTKVNETYRAVDLTMAWNRKLLSYKLTNF